MTRALAILTISAGVLLATAAVGVARFGALDAGRSDAFTQLWMLPSGDRTLRIGIVNHEGREQTYRLVLEAGGTVVRVWPRLVVGSTQTWTTAVRASPGARTRARASLFRAGRRAVYRYVTVWVGRRA